MRVLASDGEHADQDFDQGVIKAGIHMQQANERAAARTG